jgi:hypothetical protein
MGINPPTHHPRVPRAFWEVPARFKTSSLVVFEIPHHFGKFMDVLGSFPGVLGSSLGVLESFPLGKSKIINFRTMFHS